MPLALTVLWTQKHYSSLLWQRRGQAAGVSRLWCSSGVTLLHLLCIDKNFPRLNLWNGRKWLIFGWDWMHCIYSNIIQALQGSAGQVLTLGTVQFSCPTKEPFVPMRRVAKKEEKLSLSVNPNNTKMMTLIKHPSNRKLNHFSKSNRLSYLPLSLSWYGSMQLIRPSC